MRWPALFPWETEGSPGCLWGSSSKICTNTSAAAQWGRFFPGLQVQVNQGFNCLAVGGFWFVWLLLIPFKWEHLLPQKWRMVQSPSLLDKAHICHGLEVAFWFVNSPFQQVLCAEICQFANWILHFLRANSQFVIKPKFLLNLPPIFHIFPWSNSQIPRDSWDFLAPRRVTKITQGHPGGPRLAWPCQDGSGPAEAGRLGYGWPWPPGIHRVLARKFGRGSKILSQTDF